MPSECAGGISAVLALVMSLNACTWNPPRQRGADRGITQSIYRLLEQHASLQAPNSVRVETVNHVVYPYGQVNYEVERSTAQEAAQSVPGVARVVNSISLQYEGR